VTRDRAADTDRFYELLDWLAGLIASMIVVPFYR